MRSRRSENRAQKYSRTWNASFLVVKLIAYESKKTALIDGQGYEKHLEW